VGLCVRGGGGERRDGREQSGCKPAAHHEHQDSSLGRGFDEERKKDAALCDTGDPRVS
jgi:hypothetical protein